MKLRKLAVEVLLGMGVMWISASHLAYGETDLLMGQKGRILHTEGLVLVKAPGEAEWKIPQKGAWVVQGSDIKTTHGATCEIGLGENRKSLLSMKEDSQTQLSQMTDEKIKVDLKAGRVFALVRDLRPESRFEVVTPAAVASARGTGWEQDMDTVQVFERSVEVTSFEGEKKMVEEGFGIEIENGDIKEPFAIPDDPRAEWDRFEQEAEKMITEEPGLPADAGYEVPPAGALESLNKPPQTEDLSTIPGTAAFTDSTITGLSATEPQSAEMPSSASSDGFDLESPKTDLSEGAGNDFGSTDTLSPENSFDDFDNSFGDTTGSLGGFENPVIEPSGSSANTFHDIKDEQHDTTQPPPDSTKPPCSSGSTANC